MSILGRPVLLTELRSSPALAAGAAVHRPAAWRCVTDVAILTGLNRPVLQVLVVQGDGDPGVAILADPDGPVLYLLPHFGLHD